MGVVPENAVYRIIISRQGAVCCPEVYRSVPGIFHDHEHDDDADDDNDDDEHGDEHGGEHGCRAYLSF